MGGRLITGARVKERPCLRGIRWRVIEKNTPTPCTHTCTGAHTPAYTRAYTTHMPTNTEMHKIYHVYVHLKVWECVNICNMTHTHISTQYIKSMYFFFWRLKILKLSSQLIHVPSRQMEERCFLFHSVFEYFSFAPFTS